MTASVRQGRRAAAHRLAPPALTEFVDLDSAAFLGRITR
jgi:hypothetical protein